MIRLKVLLLLLVPLAVFGAGSKTFTWTPPTERENGDPLTAAEIDHFQIECGTQSGGPYNVFSTGAPGNSSTIVASDVFSEGTYYCVARTVDNNGLESVNSNETNFTVGRCEATDCKPKPPVLSVNP